MSLCSDYRESAARELDRAEYVLDADTGMYRPMSVGERRERAALHVARAQVYATLAVATRPTGGD